jgi:serine/threonine protein kinase
MNDQPFDLKPSQRLEQLVNDYLASLDQDHPLDRERLMRENPDEALSLKVFFDDYDLAQASINQDQLTTSFYEYAVAPGSGGQEVLPEGQLIGDFHIDGRIGSGGMATVYRATDRASGRIVALKVCRADIHAQERFRQELKRIRRLDHENIVRVFDGGTDEDGRLYYAMEFVTGGDLRQWAARLRLKPWAAAKMMAVVARAIHHAHARRVLHRDLKPENILLAPDGTPKVVDFGLSRELLPTGQAIPNINGPTQSGCLVGSVRYMSPEQVTGKDDLSTSVDIHALAVVFWELLTGRHPFEGKSIGDVLSKIENDAPPFPSQINGALSADFDAVCMKGLEKRPENRYATMLQMADDFQHLADELPVDARSQTRLSRFFRWCRKHPVTVLLAVLGTGFLVAATLYSLSLASAAQAELVTEAGLSNTYIASHVANGVRSQLQDLGDAVIAVAENPELRHLWNSDSASDLVAFLNEQFELWNAPNRWPHANAGQQAQGPFENLFILRADTGKIAALVPPQLTPSGVDLRPRDYANQTLLKAPARGREAVHVSRAYSSLTETGKYKIGISVPFYSKEGASTHADGIVVATLTTNSRLGLLKWRDKRRAAFLVVPGDANSLTRGATKPDRASDYVVLVHPAYEHGEQPVTFPKDRVPTLALFRDRPELLNSATGNDLPPDDDFLDPFSLRNPTNYGGRRLAGFGQVGGTEWFVVVTQRFDDVIDRPRWAYRQPLYWIAAAFILTATLGAAHYLISRYFNRLRWV